MEMAWFVWAFVWLCYFTSLIFGIIFLVLIGQNRFKSEINVLTSAKEGSM
jgi:uncharacterized membrane protein